MGAAVFKIVADYNRLQQSSRAALSTLLGSAEAANAQMDKLDAFAKNSPFAKQVFITAQQQLLGFGVEAEKVLPILDAVQNAVAAVGGSNEQVSQVTYALAQMEGQGKLTGETLNQLGQYGIDAAGILGKALGKTGAEIRELASKPGGIPVDQVWDPLVAGLMERFGGATANIKQQMDGALDRVKGATRDIGSILAAPFIDPNGGGRAVEWANKLADALRAAETKAKPFVDLIVARFRPGLEAVTPALDKVRGLINSWDLSKLNGQLDALTKYAPLVAAGSAALYAFGTQNIPILSNLGLSMNPVVAGIAALVASSPELRSAGSEFLTALTPLLPVATELGRLLLDTAMQVGDELTPSIRDLLKASAPVAVSLGTGLAPALVQVLKSVVPVAEGIGDLVSWVAQLPTPVLAATAAFFALRALDLSPVLDGVKTGASGISTAWSAMSQTVAASQATLQATGAQVGFLNTAALTARVGVSALGASLKAVFLTNPVGVAIAAVSTAIGFLVSRQQAAAQAAEEHRSRVETLAAALQRTNGVIDESVRATAVKELQDSGALKRARELGLSLSDVTDAWLDQADAGARLNAQLQRIMESNRELDGQVYISVTEGYRSVYSYNERGQAAKDLAADIASGTQVTRDAIQADKDATEALNATAEATGDAGRAVQLLNEKLQANVQAQKDAAGVAMSLREAQIAQTESQNAATEAAAAGAQIARDQAGVIDLTAASTIAADKALLDLASRNAQVTEAMAKQNATGQELYASTVAQREAFITTATSMGYTRDEAAKLANQYGLIPQTVTTKVVAETTDAQGNITRIVESLNNFNGKTYRAIVRVDAQGATISGRMQGSPIGFEAQGDVLEFYRNGGVRKKLTPMSAVAQMVPANTWRVVGDRPRGDEAFIPIEHTARSLALLDETAARLGRIVVPVGAQMNAAGSITARSSSATTPALAGLDLSERSLRRLAELLVTVSTETTRTGVRSYADLLRRGT
jgi:tape measure domain-containing protein